jgi:hypothetical protein
MERKVSSKQQRSMKNMDQPKLSTIWGDFWVQDKQLPSKTEFQVIATAKLVEIGECNIPRNQRFERINFDWSKRLNQAAKLFAQAWIYALEVHGKENLVLKAIGMTKAQVAHAIRASQTCMTFKNNARNQKDASRYFMTIVDMMIISLMLYRPKDAILMNFNMMKARFAELGYSFDEQKSHADINNLEADYNLLVANALKVIPFLLKACGSVFSFTKNTFTDKEGALFKDAMEFASKEIRVKVIAEDWLQAEPTDVAIGAQGVTHVFARIYTLYQTASRLMFEVERHARTEDLRTKKRANKVRTLVDLIYDSEDITTNYGQAWELYPFTDYTSNQALINNQNAEFAAKMNEVAKYMENPETTEKPVFEDPGMNDAAKRMIESGRKKHKTFRRTSESSDTELVMPVMNNLRASTPIPIQPSSEQDSVETFCTQTYHANPAFYRQKSMKNLTEFRDRTDSNSVISGIRNFQDLQNSNVMNPVVNTIDFTELEKSEMMAGQEPVRI